MNLKNSFKGSIYIICLAFWGIMSSCHKEKQVNPQPAPIAEKPAPTPQNPGECLTKAGVDNGSAIQGNYIVTYKPGVNLDDTLMDALKKLHIPLKMRKRIFDGQLKAAKAILSYDQLQSVKNDVNVESVEPDRVLSISSCASTIPSQTKPWGINRVGGGDGTGKTVWIIDTGVDLQHPDLNVDASRSISFIPGTTPNDDHGHGTHVAGIIAAKNNNIGVIGVAADATVIALKVMDASGKGSTSMVLEAVNYVAQHGRPGDVVNMSIGGDVSDLLDKAVTEAAKKGFLISIAAGNEHRDVSASSPGRVNHPNVFTISAINDEDYFASFSNYGDGIDYAAPGVNIPSTYKNQGYATMSGTSMATPHVSGLLLLKGRNITPDGFAKGDPDSHPDPIAHQ